MMGEASDYDPRSGRVVTTWRARDPNVEGPGGFFFADAEARHGEMEMRRRSSLTPLPERWLLTAYWALSGYGLRAARA